MTIERSDPTRDYERRGLWLAFAVGFVVFSSRGVPGFLYGGGQRFQLVMYLASLVAFALCVCLCLLLVVPDLRARLGERFRDVAGVFSWAFGLFVLGLVITIVAYAVGAIDLLDEDTPFG